MGGGGGMGNGMVQFWLLGLSASVIDFFIKIKNTTFIDPSYDINKFFLIMNNGCIKNWGACHFENTHCINKIIQRTLLLNL